MLSSTSTTSMTASTINSNSKKRKAADSIDRMTASTVSAGRGATTGWTTCPLCCSTKKTQKRFCLGRGIAAHLMAVHKPSHDTSEEDWNETVQTIVRQLEQDACKRNTIPPGYNRDGTTKASTYRASLPPFLQAAANGDMVTLQEMINSCKDDAQAIQRLLETRDRHLSVAEHWAAGGGHLDCLDYLNQLRLKYATTKQQQQSKRSIRRRDGKHSLHYAARNGHVNCINYLLDNHRHIADADGCSTATDVDVDVLSGDKTTPFHMACFGGHVDAAKLLLDRGANAAAANDWGCTAAHWAAMTQNPVMARDICQLVQRHGGDFTLPQKQGHSAMHKAAQRKNQQVIEWMFESKEQGGAGLIKEELQTAFALDQGGHTPADIWRVVGGNADFADWMLKNIGRQSETIEFCPPPS